MVLDANVSFISLKILHKCLPSAYFINNNADDDDDESYQ